MQMQSPIGMQHVLSTVSTALSQSIFTILKWMHQVGDYKWSCRPHDFDGWLLCDGRELSRAAYPALFALVGTAFGAPSSSQVFRLPDARGRVLGAADAAAHPMGTSVGRESRTITVDELPAHTHAGATSAAGAHAHDLNDPGHAHTQTTINDDFNTNGGSPPGFVGDGSGSRTWDNINAATTGVSVAHAADHAHTFTTAPAGGGAALSLMQPTLFAGSLFIYGGAPRNTR